MNLKCTVEFRAHGPLSINGVIIAIIKGTLAFENVVCEREKPSLCATLSGPGVTTWMKACATPVGLL